MIGFNIAIIVFALSVLAIAIMLILGGRPPDA